MWPALDNGMRLADQRKYSSCCNLRIRSDSVDSHGSLSSQSSNYSCGGVDAGSDHDKRYRYLPVNGETKPRHVALINAQNAAFQYHRGSDSGIMERERCNGNHPLKRLVKNSTINSDPPFQNNGPSYIMANPRLRRFPGNNISAEVCSPTASLPECGSSGMMYGRVGLEKMADERSAVSKVQEIKSPESWHSGRNFRDSIDNKRALRPSQLRIRSGSLPCNDYSLRSGGAAVRARNFQTRPLSGGLMPDEVNNASRQVSSFVRGMMHKEVPLHEEGEGQGNGDDAVICSPVYSQTGICRSWTSLDEAGKSDDRVSHLGRQIPLPQRGISSESESSPLTDDQQTPSAEPAALDNNGIPYENLGVKGKVMSWSNLASNRRNSESWNPARNSMTEKDVKPFQEFGVCYGKKKRAQSAAIVVTEGNNKNSRGTTTTVAAPSNGNRFNGGNFSKKLINENRPDDNRWNNVTVRSSPVLVKPNQLPITPQYLRNENSDLIKLRRGGCSMNDVRDVNMKSQQPSPKVFQRGLSYPSNNDHVEQSPQMKTSKSFQAVDEKRKYVSQVLINISSPSDADRSESEVELTIGFPSAKSGSISSRNSYPVAMSNWQKNTNITSQVAGQKALSSNQLNVQRQNSNSSIDSQSSNSPYSSDASSRLNSTTKNQFEPKLNHYYGNEQNQLPKSSFNRTSSAGTNKLNQNYSGRLNLHPSVASSSKFNKPSMHRSANEPLKNPNVLTTQYSKQSDVVRMNQSNTSHLKNRPDSLTMGSSTPRTKHRARLPSSTEMVSPSRSQNSPVFVFSSMHNGDNTLTLTSQDSMKRFGRHQGLENDSVNTLVPSNGGNATTAHHNSGTNVYSRIRVDGKDLSNVVRSGGLRLNNNGSSGNSKSTADVKTSNASSHNNSTATSSIDKESYVEEQRDHMLSMAELIDCVRLQRDSLLSMVQRMEQELKDKQQLRALPADEDIKRLVDDNNLLKLDIEVLNHQIGVENIGRDSGVMSEPRGGGRVSGDVMMRQKADGMGRGREGAERGRIEWERRGRGDYRPSYSSRGDGSGNIKMRISK